MEYIKILFITILISVISACGGGGSSGSDGGSAGGSNPSSSQNFGISGLVTGLGSGKSVELILNSGNTIMVRANQNFSFDTTIPLNGSYAVTVGHHPDGQTCAVTRGAGSGVVANVTDVQVACNDWAYTLSGSVSGLGTRKSVELSVGPNNRIPVRGDGDLSFSTLIAFNASYAVNVVTQPEGQNCTVTNASGQSMVANVTNVKVVCTDLYFTVSGSVNGLGPGKQLKLGNGIASRVTALTLTTNGKFSIEPSWVWGSSPGLIVATQPIGQECSIENGDVTVIADINNVIVSCVDLTYTVSVSVMGLVPGKQVTLLNNGTNATTVNYLDAGGTYVTFSTPIAFNGSYAVTVSKNPDGQTCSVFRGSGTGMVADVINVAVQCN
jgi:hypothetical protein